MELRVVFWAIVDINYVVIGVILHKNRIEISQIKAIFNVSIRGYNYAKFHLIFVVLTQIVSRLYIICLFLN